METIEIRKAKKTFSYFPLALLIMSDDVLEKPAEQVSEKKKNLKFRHSLERSCFLTWMDLGLLNSL